MDSQKSALLRLIARVAFCCLSLPAAAAQFGDFTYTSSGTDITITNYTGAGGDVTIPSTIISLPVKNIGDTAFYQKAALTSVTIPASVTSIGAHAFSRSTAMTAFAVDEANPYYCSLSGVLFDKAQTALIQCPARKTGTYTIPGSVTFIGSAAFFGCTGLTSVTIPASVTIIDDWAFALCSGLTTVSIPASVISIGGEAFVFCNGLTSVSIPASVTSISIDAFAACTAMKEIAVDAVNTSYSSLSGVLFNKAQTSLIQCPAGKSGTYTIPKSVTSIERDAFYSCTGLTSVTIPASVANIQGGAFYSCTGLTSAMFTGKAPTMGSSVFSNVAASFKVYFFNGALGFTTATWQGYPSVNMGEATPIATWLVENGLPYNASLQEDANGDGANLLMAYALNLDPKGNLTGSMPKPVIEANQLSLTYYAGNGDVIYSVETSTDLQRWTSEGVTISAPDANQVRTATVDMTWPHRYMRVVVVH